MTLTPDSPPYWICTGIYIFIYFPLGQYFLCSKLSVCKVEFFPLMRFPLKRLRLY